MLLQSLVAKVIIAHPRSTLFLQSWSWLWSWSWSLEMHGSTTNTWQYSTSSISPYVDFLYGLLHAAILKEILYKTKLALNSSYIHFIFFSFTCSKKMKSRTYTCRVATAHSCWQKGMNHERKTFFACLHKRRRMVWQHHVSNAGLWSQLPLKGK